MKIIFLEDVPPHARAGDIKEVKNGYARNFLLPRGLATMATVGEVKRVSELYPTPEAAQAAMEAKP